MIFIIISAHCVHLHLEWRAQSREIDRKYRKVRMNEKNALMAFVEEGKKKNIIEQVAFVITEKTR